MKLLTASLAALAFASTSCNNEPKTSTETATVKDSPAAPTSEATLPAAVCYTREAAGDTFFLQLNMSGDMVTGNLNYIFKEKDSNRGQLEGKMIGDTLLADYTFMSEGQKSVRQVAFLIKDSEATGGYGDLVDKDGKMLFKNPHALTFGKGIVMTRTNCAQ